MASEGKCRGCDLETVYCDAVHPWCDDCADFRDSIARPIIIDLASSWAKQPAMVFVKPRAPRQEFSNSLYVDGGDDIERIDPPKPADIAKRWAEIAYAAADAALEERKRQR